MKATFEAGFLGVGQATRWCASVIRGTLSPRVVQYLDEAMRQARILVSGSLPVLLGMAFALGLVLGIQGVHASRTIGAPAVAGAFAGLGNLREVVPYAFAWMMAAKVSTGYVAELGTMRISDEIDALDVMGFDSQLYLAGTRLLALLMVLPFVFPLALAMGYIGSYIAVVIQLGEISRGGFLELFWKFQSPTDYIFSAIKGLIMSSYVVLVGCFAGYHVQGGPVGVGRAAATTMVVNLVGISVIGIITSQLFWGGNARLPIGG